MIGRVSPLPPLRSKLLVLAAVGVVPMLALSLVLGYFLIEHERQTIQDSASARSRTLLTAVDTKILGYLGTLHALAASASLESGDLSSFDAEARRVLGSQQPDWRNILLVDPSGQQVLNLRFAPGAVLPNEAQLDNPGFREVVQTRRPYIGNLNAGPVSKQPGIAIRVPVMQAADSGQPARLRYVLEFIVEPTALAELIRAQKYSSTWIAALIDRNGRFIARLPAPPKGDSTTAAFMAEMQRNPEGWYHGRSLEGKETYTAHKVSELTGWTVAVALPSS
jgi:hypothetical protein